MTQASLLHLFNSLRSGSFQLQGRENEEAFEILVVLLDSDHATFEQLKYLLAITDALACQALQHQESGPDLYREVLFKICKAGINFCLKIVEQSSGAEILQKANQPKQKVQLQALLLLATLVIDGRAAGRGDGALKLLLELSEDDFPEYRIEHASVKAGPFSSSVPGQPHILTLLAGDAYGPQSNSSTLASGLSQNILFPPWGTSALQDYAVTQLHFFPRLFAACTHLAKQAMIEDSLLKDCEDGINDVLVYNTSLELCSSILTMLVNVGSGRLGVATRDANEEILSLVDAIPPLYGLVEGSLSVSKVPGIVDDVLKMMALCLPSVNTFQNMRVNLVVAILAKMELSKSALDKFRTKQGADDTHDGFVRFRPVISTPYAVSHLLELIQNIHAESRTMKGVHISGNAQIERAVSKGNTGESGLEVPETMEKQIGLLFPSGSCWLENFISTSLLLYEDWKLHTGFQNSLHHSELTDVEESMGRLQEESVSSRASEEDEVWFGDLFAEPGRHSEEGTSPKKRGNSSQHGRDVGYLQAAQQILVFLNELIVAPEWEQEVFLSVKGQLQELHLDAILTLAVGPLTFIHTMKRSDLGRSRTDTRNMEDPGETQIENYAANLVCAAFDFLEALLVKCALNEELETQLAHKLLSNGMKDEKAERSPAVLILLAKLLIQRSARSYVSCVTSKQQPFIGNDVFILELFQSFYQSIMQIAATAAKSGLTSTMAKLPCLLLLEVLVMSFHILSDYGKTQARESALSCLTTVISQFTTLPNSGLSVDSSSVGDIGGSTAGEALAAWLLPVSRLVLVIRHMVYHSGSFPSWLPRHLRHCFRHKGLALFSAFLGHVSEGTVDTMHKLDNMQKCWGSKVLWSLEACSWEDVLVELADPMGEPSPEYEAESFPVKSLSADFNRLATLISRLLNLASNYVPSTQEEYLVERYIYHICWKLVMDLERVEPSAVQQKDTSTAFSMLCQLTAIKQRCLKGEDSVDATTFEHTVVKILSSVSEKLQSGRVVFGSFEYLRLQAVLQCCLDLILAGFQEGQGGEHLSVTSRPAASSSISASPPVCPRPSTPGSVSEDSESDDGAVNKGHFVEPALAVDLPVDGVKATDQAVPLLHLPCSQHLYNRGHQLMAVIQSYIRSDGGRELLQILAGILTWHVEAWRSAVRSVFAAAIPGSPQERLATTLLLQCPGQDPSRLASDFETLGVQQKLVETLLWPGGLEATQEDAFRVVIGGSGYPVTGKSSSYLGQSFAHILLGLIPSSGGSLTFLVLLCQLSVCSLLKTLDLVFNCLLHDPKDASAMIEEPNISRSRDLRALLTTGLESLLSSLMDINQEAAFVKLRIQCRTVLDQLFSSQAEVRQALDMHSLYRVEILLRESVREINVATQTLDPVLVKCISCMEKAWSSSQPAFLQYFEGVTGSTSLSVSDGEAPLAGPTSPGSGDLSFLIEILDNNISETVNISVLRLLLAVLQVHGSEPHRVFKRSISRTLQAMDSTKLALWLEHRFLGSVAGDVLLETMPSPIQSRRAPQEVRSLVYNFLESLVQEESPALDREKGKPGALRNCLVEALLLNVDKAFAFYDPEAAREYLLLLVRLARDESVTRVLETVLASMEKFQLSSQEHHYSDHSSNSVLVANRIGIKNSSEGAGIESSWHRHLENLQTVLIVLNSALAGYCRGFKGDTSDQQVASVGEMGLYSNWLKDRVEPGIEQGSQNREEAGVLRPSALTSATANSVGQVLVEDSADEEEDDDLTDGEVEDEEGLGGGERELASRICTYTSSGNNFMEQHWYFCYSCDLTVSKGCCSVCAAVCHKGHKVVYSRHSRFFCDCGAGASGGIRAGNCISLKPRRFRPPGQPSRAPPPLPPGAPSGGPSGSFVTPMLGQSLKRADVEDFYDEEEEAELNADDQRLPLLAVTKDGHLLGQLRNLECRLLSVCQKLLAFVETQQPETGIDDELDLSTVTLRAVHGEVLRLKRAFKSGSLDMKTKTEYPKDRELKALLGSGLLGKSIVSVSSKGRMAAGEGDKVTVLDVGQLIGQPTVAPVTVDKTTVKALSRNAVRFGVVHVEFNPANESFLAVAGFEDCQVFTLNSGGEVIDRLAVDLSLQGGAHIRRISWLPNSQVRLMVVTSQSVEVFDLSLDHRSPCVYLTVDGDSIQDAVLVPVAGRQLTAVVLTQQSGMEVLQGVLYSERLDPRKDNSGPVVLKSTVTMPDGNYSLGKGTSLCYSAALRFLVVAFEESRSLFGRLNSDATGFKEVAGVEVEQESQNRSRYLALQQWHEILPGAGLFIWTQSGSVFAVQVRKGYLEAQQLRMAPSSSSLRLDGVGAYQPPSGDRSAVFLLNDDGSLQIFSYSPPGTEQEARAGNGPGDASKVSNLSEVEQARRLGVALTSLRTSETPTFPFDFFERSLCITPDIKLGGDILRNTDAEAAKLSVSGEDGFLESPSLPGFKLMVFNANSDLVMVGCRIHVGNTAASHIPSTVTVFNRTIRLEEGVRRWYEIPFTNLESLLADKEFTLTIGPSFNGSALPRIDNLDVYARTKEDFGFIEKVESVLEQDGQGRVTAGVSSSMARSHNIIATERQTPLEQALSCAFRSLRLFYKAASLDGFRGDMTSKAGGLEGRDTNWKTRNGQGVDVQEGRLHSEVLTLLRPILETGVHQRLQVAARGVLRALYPTREAYCQVKDEMRLAGVAKSMAAIQQRVLKGGRNRSAAVSLFMEHLQAACRIAAGRFVNFSAFLDKHGVGIIQGLIEAMWAVEEASQPEGHPSNQLVFSTVDLLYAFSQYLVNKGEGPPRAISAQLEPAVTHIRTLLFAPAESVSSGCSLALSSRLLQLPPPKPVLTHTENLLPETAVQYCCDGCKKCPIIHHRWHCTVCPDFDLCESCYQSMFAGSLTVAHSLDHSMVAIPIDGDGAGEWQTFSGHNGGQVREGIPSQTGDVAGHQEQRPHDGEHAEGDGIDEDREDYMDVEEGEVEGQEDQIGIPEAWRDAYELMEDMSEEALLELAKEISLHEQQSGQEDPSTEGVPPRASSPPKDESIDSLSESLGPSWQHNVPLGEHLESIASRQNECEVSSAIGRLLLQQLIVGMNGWMKRCSGMDALPVFQLFYRLGVASARGSGPLATVIEEAKALKSGRENADSLRSPQGSEEEESGGLNLEGLVAMLLQELDLSSPLPVDERTERGEVAILTFMFLALVLRNWRQPGSDSALEGIVNSSFTELEGQGAADLSLLSNASGLVQQEAARQLERACALLLRKPLLPYLLDVVTRLSPHFKAASTGVGGDGTPGQMATSQGVSGHGGLSVARREIASGTFAPFFSNSYAKIHRGDLFGEFHKLLLESTFRLAYSLIRQRSHGESKSSTNGLDFVLTESQDSGKAVEEVKLEGWQDVLCSYMSNTHASFIRKYARQLLLHVCGSKGHYYAVRDSWQLSAEIKRINKLSKKSNCFRNPMSYERRVKLVRCLAVLADVATSRPRNWQRHCLRNTEALPFLLDSAAFWDEESALISLKLIGLAFQHTSQGVDKADGVDSGSTGVSSGGKSRYGSGRHGLGSDAEIGSEGAKEKRSSRRRRSGDEGGEKGDKGPLDMEQQVTILFGNSDAHTLGLFIDHFLLEWSAFSVRAEAKTVLQGAWHHGNKTFRTRLLISLLNRLPAIPSYGHNVDKFSELLSWLISKGVPARGSSSSVPDSKQVEEKMLIRSSLDGPVLNSMLMTLREQNELLANHPNSRLYNTLRSVVEFDGYYLESEPCLACSSPEVAYSRMKLDGLKLETKFTDNRILVKCTSSHTIQSVSMSVLDARRSKAVKCVKLYYNNRAVADLAELKNSWSLWKRARTCHLVQGQTELRVDFAIPITACNFMIEFDSFYENLQASSLESLQCPRCSRYVTDKHGTCSNCHENAYQCRQCRNINYEKLDAFLCIECGYSKYGRFDFSFVAKPSFVFDPMENDEDMRKGLAAIEAEAENAHRKYQMLLSFKKPLLKLISSVGETDSDASAWSSPGPPGPGTGNTNMPPGSVQAGGAGVDAVQQAMVSLPASSSFKINRKIALLGILYGEKCKSAFDSVSKSVQTLLGLQKVLMVYLERKGAVVEGESHNKVNVQTPPRPPQRPSNKCYGCANTSVGFLLEWLQVLARDQECRRQLVAGGILRDLFESNIHHGPRSSRTHARSVLCLFTEGDLAAAAELNSLIYAKVAYCLEHHRSLDVAACIRDEMQLLSEACALADDCWEARLRAVFSLLFKAIEVGARHPVICEHIILPCLKIVAQACLPPTENSQASGAILGSRSGTTTVGGGISLSPITTPLTDVRSSSRSSVMKTFGSSTPKPSGNGVTGGRNKGKGKGSGSDETNLISYAEWTGGTGYNDFERRHLFFSVASQSGRPPLAPRTFSSMSVLDRERPANSISKSELSALKCFLKWRRKAKVNVAKNGTQTYGGGLGLTMLENASWVKDLVLSACSQTIRLEACSLIQVLSATSPSRHARFLQLIYSMLPDARLAGESAAEYFDLFNMLVETEEWRLFLTVQKFLPTVCALMVEEVVGIEGQERSFHTNIAQGYSVHKLALLLAKFLQVQSIRKRFLEEKLLSPVLDSILALRGLVVQKTKPTEDCRRLLVELLDSLLKDNPSSKRSFLTACVGCLQAVRANPGRTPLYILEQLCGVVCPSRAEPIYQLVLTKAHTQEEYIRGSMTKNPYSSAEVGPLMRDVKNKICQQLELLGLLEDDYGMELLVAGNIISLDLSVRRVFEIVWRKAQASQPGGPLPSLQDCPPMTVTFRLQGLDGEATEPIIKELDDEQEEALDPEVEFAVAGVMADCGGLAVLLNMVQDVSEEEMKSGQQEVALLLKLLLHCCKLRANRLALLRLGALPVLLDQARRAFFLSSDGSTAGEDALEFLLLSVETLVAEANENEALSDSTSVSSLLLENVNQEEAFSQSSGSTVGRSGLGVEAVRMFLDKLSTPQTGTGIQVGGRTARKRSRGGGKSTETVARILPYLTFGEQQAMEVLVEYFLPFLQDWQDFDRLQERARGDPKDEAAVRMAAEHRQAVSNFIRVSEAIRLDTSGNRLRSLILGRGIPAGAVRYLMSAFPKVDTNMEYKSLDDWAAALRLSSVPLLLALLEGLCKGHLPTQVCLLEEGVLPLLHALEGVPGEGNVGARAESLMDTLAGGGENQLKEVVDGLREATKKEMRRRALQRREELLKGMGMARQVRSDGERIVVTRPAGLEGLELVEEEEKDALSCMVCREGYRLRPQDMLGAYCFSKRFNFTSASSARMEWMYSTVTHFNVIHFQCHLEAKRADSALKAPKKEWEGAALRNSETLCNGLFPLRGPEVSSAQYVRCCDLWWDHVTALGRADGSRLRLLLHDIVTLIGRFATNASFSSDSKGGGRDSNVKMLPFQLQMATFLLDQAGPTQRRVYEGILASYVAATPSKVGITSKTTASPTSGSPGTTFVGSPTWEMSGVRMSLNLPPGPGRPQPIGASRSPDETVQFMLMWSLLVQPLGQWEEQRRGFLQRALAQAYHQYRNGVVGSGVLPTGVATGLSTSNLSSRSPIAGASIVSPSQSSPASIPSSSSLFTPQSPVNVSIEPGRSVDEKAVLSAVKSMIIFVGLIDQLQMFLKGSRSTGMSKGNTKDGEENKRGKVDGGSKESGATSSVSSGAEERALQLDPWEVTMRHRLVNIDSMLKFTADLLEWIEDVQGATDLQEVIDTSGFLADALSHGYSSCDAFVWAAVNGEWD